MLQKYMKFYNDISTKDITEEDIALLEVELNVNTLVNVLLYEKKSFNEEDMALMEVIIRILQFVYNNSSILSPLPDAEYDKLYELYRDLTHKEIVGSIQARDKLIDYHAYPELRGTLHKIHHMTNDEKNDKRKSLEDYIKSVETILGRKLKDGERRVRLTPKWDGLSVIFEVGKNDKMIKALTRGDVEKNEAVNITKLFRDSDLRQFKPDNITGEYGLKTEVIMPFNKFDEYTKVYGMLNNTRSAVSSIINSNDLDPNMMNYMQIMPIQIQDKDTGNIYVPDIFYNKYMQVICDIKDTEAIMNGILEIRKNIVDFNGLPIDGIVLSFIDANIQSILGRDHNINIYEVAYKFPAEQAKTILKDVEFSIGKLGSITPVAKVEPVIMNGNTISSISLGSPERFISLDLHEGDEVIIQYDIIPYLLKDDGCKKGKGEMFKLPKECPYCGKKLEHDPILKCVNMDCPSRIIGKILNYVTKMGIPNISIATITTLFNHKYLESIIDLYTLSDKKQEIVSLSGFGELSFNKIISGIEMRNELYDYQLLGSIAISNIGVRMFKKVMTQYTIDDLIKISKNNEINKLTILSGIQVKTAKKIIEGVLENLELISFLLGRLKVKRDERKYTIQVCFTKVRDEEFEKYLDSIGVMVLDNYNKNVDIVIVPDKNTTSSKVDKAIKANKEILTIDEAYKVFKYELQ